MDTTPPDVAVQLAELHAEIYERVHFYQIDEPQCYYKSIVGAFDAFGIGGEICVCELVQGHQEPHERIPTGRTAVAEDTVYLPVFRNFRGRENRA